jgi:hypothetical protein
VAELTLEMLRTELSPMRVKLDSLPIMNRALVAMQQELRALRVAFNDFALQNVTLGEIQALHDDVNRVQAQNAELEIRIATLERLISELREK